MEITEPPGKETRKRRATGPSADRSRAIRRIARASAFSWVVFQLSMQVLFGPHISAMRAVTIGASVGAGVGLFFSFIQWLVLRQYVQEAGWWIPATTTGTTFGGALGSLLDYYALLGTDIYLSSWQTGGLLSGFLIGVVIAWPQWLVARNWSNRPRDWFIPMALGTALSSSLAWGAQWAVTVGLVELLGEARWTIAIIAGIAAGTTAGATIYAYFLARALNKVLPRN